MSTDFVGTDLTLYGKITEELVLYVEEVRMDPTDSIKTATTNAVRTVLDITAAQGSVSTVYKAAESRSG